MTNAINLIAKKRDGNRLTRDEITFMVHEFTAGRIPDYQASAWLMAIYLQGMDRQETIDLTMAMVNSGQVLDLKSIAPVVVDKHSTGGVGDKTTLVVAPLVAAAGLPVGKMTGRGLGFSGGTVDKLESIPGFNATLTIERFMEILTEHSIVVSGQSQDLAPADGKLYALRDVTATVESIPLIASSIMSKKIAGGADAIVLDVKVGSGAFMKREEDALALAETMVDIGRGLGREVVAVISDMSQPLGDAVGNALEVKEAIETLHGCGPADFTEHCSVIAAYMLHLGNKCQDVASGETMARELLAHGQALAKFQEWVAAQGGLPEVADDPGLLPQARLIEKIPAPRSGYVATIDAMGIGLRAMQLGAGRAKKGDAIDPAVGIVLRAKVGDWVEKGQPLLTIHANDEARLAAVQEGLTDAYAWSDEPVEPPPLTHRVVSEQLQANIVPS